VRLQVVIGATIGARSMVRIQSGYIKAGFGVILLLFAVQLVLKTGAVQLKGRSLLFYCPAVLGKQGSSIFPGKRRGNIVLFSRRRMSSAAISASPVSPSRLPLQMLPEVRRSRPVFLQP